MNAEGLLSCYRHLLSRWHDRAGGRLRAAVSCSAPQRVTRDYFEALDDLSRRDNLPFYMHILETRLQRVLGQENFGGRSLIQYVQQMGLLTERLNIIHGIWIDETDMDLIADAGSVVAHNPISNLRLGSGIMPFHLSENTILLGGNQRLLALRDESDLHPSSRIPEISQASDGSPAGSIGPS